MQTEIDAIVDYWLGPNEHDVDVMRQQWRLWYTASKATDNTIRQRFGANLAAAEADQLSQWQETPKGCVALTILLDQFTRNLHRGTADAFRNDARALNVASALIAKNEHPGLSIAGQVMLFHPFHHAESEEAQAQAIHLFTGLLARSPEPWQSELEKHLRFVRNHAEIIRRFGRFPHRNAILARSSTAEELAFLKNDARTYGQTAHAG